MRVWRESAQAVKKNYGELPDECRRYFIIRCIIDSQVKDVVWTTEERIARAGVRSAHEVRLQARPLVQYSPKRRKLNLELRDYLYKNLYFNPEVREPNRRAVRQIPGNLRIDSERCPLAASSIRRRCGRGLSGTEHVCAGSRLRQSGRAARGCLAGRIDRGTPKECSFYPGLVRALEGAGASL